MLNKREVLSIALIIIFLSFSVSLIKTTEIFLQSLLFVSLILMINITAKKVAGFYLDSKIEIKLWEIKQYGFAAHKYFKKPFPAGAFLPVLSKIIFFPINGLVWMASLVFDVKPKTYKAAKRHGLYSFSEVSENQLAIIAAIGILANLIFAVVGYLVGWSDFARLNIFYAFFNMIPISNLDGNKIFFGNIILWSFLASITLIGLFYALFTI